MCISALLSLFGCGKKDIFILDGPGMVYTPELAGFNLTNTKDGYSFEYSIDDVGQASVKGNINSQHPVLDAVTVSPKTKQDIDALHLELLDNSDDSDSSDLVLELLLTSGNTVKKQVTTATCQQIYDILFTYLINN